MAYTFQNERFYFLMFGGDKKKQLNIKKVWSGWLVFWYAVHFGLTVKHFAPSVLR